MKSIFYQLGVLLITVITTAAVTRKITKEEDEERFLQFKQNMNELKKENQKLREKISDDEEEIESLEKEVTKAKYDYSQTSETNDECINFINEYQSIAKDIFKNISKPVRKVINEEYLNLADEIIHVEGSKELSKLIRQIDRVDCVVENPLELEVPVNDVESFMQQHIDFDKEEDNEEDYDEDDEDEEDDDDINVCDMIGRMGLDDIITAEEYKNICDKIDDLEDEEDAFNYKSILDNILEYIFIKRQIATNSTHKNEIQDLNYIIKLNIENGAFSIKKDVLENIEEFYDNMRFSIVNINEVYGRLKRYQTVRDNEFLNKIKFFNSTAIKLIPIILSNIDKDYGITTNDERISIVMTLSSIMRKIDDIIDNKYSDKAGKEFNELLDDLVHLSDLSLSKEKMKKHMIFELEAIEEYNEMVEEYLENMESSDDEDDGKDE